MRYCLYAGSVVLLLLGLSLASCSSTRTATSPTVTPHTTASIPNQSTSYPKGFPLYGGSDDFLALDAQGNLYVSDGAVSNSVQRILKLSPTGRELEEWHPFIADTLFQGIAVDAQGNSYLAVENSILKLSPAGKVLTTWDVLGGPSGVAVDKQNDVYVTLYDAGKIQKFSSTGQLLTTWGKKGKDSGQLFYPNGIAVDSQGTIYVADGGNARVQTFSSVGKLLTVWGTFGRSGGQFLQPSGIAVDLEGNVYVADRGNSLVQKFSATGRLLAVWGKTSNSVQFNQPNSLVVNAQGEVYVVEPRLNGKSGMIVKLSPAGEVLAVWQ